MNNRYVEATLWGSSYVTSWLLILSPSYPNFGYELHPLSATAWVWLIQAVRVVTTEREGER